MKHDPELIRELEARRIAEIKARGEVPEECGPEIPVSPARGAFRVFEPMALYPDGKDGYAAKPAGHAGRKAIQNADAFDVMAAKAARHGKPSPFTPTQIAMGRHYRDLVERYEAAGVRCSSIESQARSSGGNGGEFIDAVLRDRERIAMLQRRIGDGSALVVRRIRPSQRGTRTGITDRRLVDMVCIEERTMSEILRAHGWSIKAGSIKALNTALAASLDRLAGGFSALKRF